MLLFFNLKYYRKKCDNMKEPLAYRVRPTKLDDVLGQEHILGKDKFMSNMLNNNTICSMILYGKPGTGKTTIATIIASTLNIKYKLLNAVICNKKDIEAAIFEANLNDSYILIIDEVHRLNKNIQDILLPHIENGTIILIGATTSNPYHSINSAIRSRCHLVEIKSLTNKDIVIALNRALKNEKGLNNQYKIDDDALELLANYSGGDLRFALNKLEIAAYTTNENKIITKEIVNSVVKKANTTIDKDEDGHYDAVSALQKSIRGSDVDAALYYLARLIAADDLDSIERRLLVTAYEDIGLANPAAVDRTYNAIQTAKMVGFPEASIPLGFAVVELALSPKSKSADVAIKKALEVVNTKDFQMPDYLKLTPVGLKDNEKYNYDRLDLVEKIQYLPSLIKDMKFYEPNYNSGLYELSLIKNYERLSKINRTAQLKELYKK